MIFGKEEWHGGGRRRKNKGRRGIEKEVAN